MQIKWLNKALKNLEDEAEYIAKDDPVAAKVVVQRIVDTVNLLSDNPTMGHPGRIHDTRELVIANTRYIVPYRVRSRLKCIEILRVFHASHPETYPELPLLMVSQHKHPRHTTQCCTSSTRYGLPGRSQVW